MQNGYSREWINQRLQAIQVRKELTYEWDVSSIYKDSYRRHYDGGGFVCSSLIYDEDRVPFVVRGLIQLVICASVLLVGYFISGGIPDGAGFGVGAIYFLVEMVFVMILWLGNFIYFLYEARTIKRKLDNLNKVN